MKYLRDTYDNFRKKVEDFFNADPISKYLIIITSTIAFILVIEAFWDGSRRSGIFISLADKKFIQDFVEWFGVIYGFIWSTIVVKVWEQFEELNSTFDREADAIQLLMEDLHLLNPRHYEFRSNALIHLQEYVQNVRNLMVKDITIDEEETSGNRILMNIRNALSFMFHPDSDDVRESEVLLGEILTQINTIVDNRSDRISLLSRNTFNSLKFISVVTSIVWLAPFYLLDYTDYSALPVIPMQFGIFGWLLVISVTFLVIIIMSIMDDLNTPFDGFWTVDRISWEKLYTKIVEEIHP